MSLFIYLFRCNSLEISPVSPPVAKHTIRLKGKCTGRRKEERNVSELQQGRHFSPCSKSRRRSWVFNSVRSPREASVTLTRKAVRERPQSLASQKHCLIFSPVPECCVSIFLHSDTPTLHLQSLRRD